MRRNRRNKGFKGFKPKKTPRYLIGQVGVLKAHLDLRIYNEHKFRIFSATPLVDTKPPKMNPYNYLKVPKLVMDAQRLSAIDKENKMLMQRINEINRTMGSIDSYNPHAYQSSSKWQSHQFDMMKIYRDNLNLYRLITKSYSTYSLKSHKAFWSRVYKVLQHSTKFPLVALFKENVDKIISKMPSLTNCAVKLTYPRCFMDFKIQNSQSLGRIVIELYDNYVPVTVQNFMSLCRGDTELSYRNCHVHKIVPGKYIELGDITKRSGRGGTSIFGETFAEENYFLKHSRPGVVSMIRVGQRENNSMFSITFHANEDLNGKRVAFGKVISGMDTVYCMEGMGRKFAKPMPVIYVSKCGDWPEAKTKRIKKKSARA